jgi:lysozyme family protein
LTAELLDKKENMSLFDIAYDITMQHEGGYAFDPVDTGGETYKGIARRFHPNWTGWGYIDAAKLTHSGKKDFLESLGNNMELRMAVRLFYISNFWNIFSGDDIKEQILANTLFDTAVSMGASRAILFLQKGLNVLNKNATLWEDLVEDGQFGNKTHAVLLKISSEDTKILVKMIMVLRGGHYIEFMRKSPIQEKFARGWFNRTLL